MQESSSSATAPKPFLRRGSGWEARVAATREGRRYLPRGGPVKDYSQEQEPPILGRRRRAAAASRKVISPCKPLTIDSTNGARRRTSGGTKAPALPDQFSLARAQHATGPPPAIKHRPQQPAVSQVAAAGNVWTRKLLSEGAAAGLRGARTQPEQLQAEEQVGLAHCCRAWLCEELSVPLAAQIMSS
jgi:hypothetical protein